MAKRSTIRITKQVVDRLAAGSDIWDAEVKGFGVRGRANGKTYVLKAAVQGHPRWITIGRHGSPWTPDEARIEAKKLLGEIVQGKDPTEAKKFNDRVRLTELCTRYLEQYAAQKKKASSVSLDRANIQNHVLPLIGERYLDELKTHDIEAFRDAVRDGKTAPDDVKAKRKAQGGGIVVRGGPGVANRTLTLLSTMFNLAEKWGLRPKGSNPVKDVTRFKEHAKERFLKADELIRLNATLDQFEQKDLESIYAIAAVRLLIMTGARLSEILTLQWDHVQLERSCLRLPDSKTGAKSISLYDQPMALLRELPRIHGNPFVIVGRRPKSHLVDLQRPWQRIRKAAALSDVRIHDLRHSYASFAVQNGFSLSLIGELLGHGSTETTKRYAHYGQSHLTQESAKIGALLTAAMTGNKTEKG